MGRSYGCRDADKREKAPTLINGGVKGATRSHQKDKFDGRASAPHKIEREIRAVVEVWVEI